MKPTPRMVCSNLTLASRSIFSRRWEM
jgi:hypothetical protein